MPWLYRLQTRAGLAGPEGVAAVVLVLALAGGLAAQRMQAAAAPLAPDFYAAADAAFVAASTPDSVALSGAGLAEAASADTTDSHDHSSTVWAAPPEPTVVDAANAVVEASASRPNGRKPPPVRTNINTATSEELQRLPRIGPAIAARILEYRRVHGRFGSAAELNEVKGIGDKTMEKLAPWVFV